MNITLTKVLLLTLMMFILAAFTIMIQAQFIPLGCYCYGGCYYCLWDNQNQRYDCAIVPENGPGGCFCIENPCHIRLLCGQAH